MCYYLNSSCDSFAKNNLVVPKSKYYNYYYFKMILLGKIYQINDYKYADIIKDVIQYDHSTIIHRLVILYT